MTGVIYFVLISYWSEEKLTFTTKTCSDAGFSIEYNMGRRGGSFLNLIFKFFYVMLFRCIRLAFSPIAHLNPSVPDSHSYSPPWSMPTNPLFVFLYLSLSLLSPIFTLPTHLWSLSFSTLVINLWFYIAHLFVLLIRLHLQVRLYDISSFLCTFLSI